MNHLSQLEDGHYHLEQHVLWPQWLLGTSVRSLRIHEKQIWGTHREAGGAAEIYGDEWQEGCRFKLCHTKSQVNGGTQTVLIQIYSHWQSHTHRHITDIQKDENAKINAQMLGRNIYIPPLMFPWRGGYFYCTIQKGKVWKELFWLLSIPSLISPQRRSDLSDWWAWEKSWTLSAWPLLGLPCLLPCPHAEGKHSHQFSGTG